MTDLKGCENLDQDVNFPSTVYLVFLSTIFSDEVEERKFSWQLGIQQSHHSTCVTLGKTTNLGSLTCNIAGLEDVTTSQGQPTQNMTAHHY